MTEKLNDMYNIENFDPKPDEELICGVCKCVFNDPVECQCRHVFCRHCIVSWLKRGKSCPICRKRSYSFELERVMVISNMVSRLTLNCPNKDHGCKEKLILSDYTNHVKQCLFEIAPGEKVPLLKAQEKPELKMLICTKDCNISIPEYKLKDHNCIEELKRRIAILNTELETLRKVLTDQDHTSVNDHPRCGWSFKSAVDCVGWRAFLNEDGSGNNLSVIYQANHSEYATTINHEDSKTALAASNSSLHQIPSKHISRSTTSTSNTSSISDSSSSDRIPSTSFTSRTYSNSNASSAPDRNSYTSGTSSTPENNSSISGTSSTPENNSSISGTSSTPDSNSSTSGTSSTPDSNSSISGTSSTPDSNSSISGTSLTPDSSSSTSGTSLTPNSSSSTSGTSSAQNCTPRRPLQHIFVPFPVVLDSVATVNVSEISELSCAVDVLDGILSSYVPPYR